MEDSPDFDEAPRISVEGWAVLKITATVTSSYAMSELQCRDDEL